MRFVDRSYGEDFCAEPHASTMLQFIRDISTTPWSAIRSQTSGGHRKHHEMDPAVIAPDAQGRITAQQLDRVFEELFRFRVGSRARLWGFELEGTFYVLWWDPEHRVYPTEPG